MCYTINRNNTLYILILRFYSRIIEILLQSFMARINSILINRFIFCKNKKKILFSFAIFSFFSLDVSCYIVPIIGMMIIVISTVLNLGRHVTIKKKRRRRRNTHSFSLPILARTELSNNKLCLFSA